MATARGRNMSIPPSGISNREGSDGPVGSNPWVKEPLKFNLATICERYGGGGHPRVGAISFPIGAIGEARQAALEIAAELRR